MKRCPKCAEEVQDAAKVCKHCGHSFAFKMPNIGCLGGIAIFVTAAALYGAFDDKPNPSFDAQLENASRTVRIERLVKARLRDPGSATFKHLDGGCGYVNSKNGFGGMGGEVPFVVGSNDIVAFRGDSPKAFDIVWKQHCLKGITP